MNNLTPKFPKLWYLYKAIAHIVRMCTLNQCTTQVVHWLSVSRRRWGWTWVGIPQQAFVQGWLLLVLLTFGALSDPVLIDAFAHSHADLSNDKLPKTWLWKKYVSVWFSKSHVTTNNHLELTHKYRKCLSWDPDPSPSSLSRAYAFTMQCWCLLSCQKATTMDRGRPERLVHLISVVKKTLLFSTHR